jgi:hypothetical protein
MERVDERAARLVGLLVLLIIVLQLRFPSIIWLILLSVDFAARAFYRPASPFARLSRCAARRLGAPRIVDAAPKIFAARIGLILSAAALLCWLIGWGTGWQLLLATMGVCAFFEVFFGYCVGCRFYTLWVRIMH